MRLAGAIVDGLAGIRISKPRPESDGMAACAEARPDE
jgi:hypothetical protein